MLFIPASSKHIGLYQLQLTTPVWYRNFALLESKAANSALII